MESLKQNSPKQHILTVQFYLSFWFQVVFCSQTHPDLMVNVVQGLLSAMLHFGHERASRLGRVAESHIGMKVAAQTAANLGLVENSLYR